MENHSAQSGEIPPEFYHYRELSFARRFFGHLHTVHLHRKYVRQGCFKLGLYHQGLWHDLSKYSPREFFRSVKFYDGHRSPNAIDRRFNGVSTAWLHHKGRNRHHFEYWIDVVASEGGVIGCRMPMRYVAEMVCDRRAACMAYHGKDYDPADAWNYYEGHRRYVMIDPESRAVLEKALLLMRDEGEDACFDFLKKCLSVTKGSGYTAGTFGLSSGYQPS